MDLWFWEVAVLLNRLRSCYVLILNSHLEMQLVWMVFIYNKAQIIAILWFLIDRNLQHYSHYNSFRSKMCHWKKSYSGIWLMFWLFVHWWFLLRAQKDWSYCDWSAVFNEQTFTFSLAVGYADIITSLLALSCPLYAYVSIGPYQLLWIVEGTTTNIARKSRLLMWKSHFFLLMLEVRYFLYVSFN